MLLFFLFVSILFTLYSNNIKQEQTKWILNYFFNFLLIIDTWTKNCLLLTKLNKKETFN